MNLFPGTPDFVTAVEVSAYVHLLAAQQHRAIAVAVQADGTVRVPAPRGHVRYGRRLTQRAIAADLQRRVRATEAARG